MVIENANLPDNKICIVVGPTQTKRLAEATRSTAQSVIRALGIATVGPHHLNPGERLQCSKRTPDPTPTGSHTTLAR